MFERLWLMRPLNECFDMRDWRGACIGKGRVTSLNVVTQVVFISMFSVDVADSCEKKLGNIIDVFMAFMNLKGLRRLINRLC